MRPHESINEDLVREEPTRNPELDNKVELLGHYGGDFTHAQSAWTSTSREIDEEKRARIPALLQMLAANNHGTPFEKSYLHFLVECDIASDIHLLKHRIGVSINGESARYRELKDDRIYVPEDWPPALQNFLYKHTKDSYDKYHFAIKELERNGVDRKRAKESARFFLPYSIKTKMDVGFNFRSWVHFLQLRLDPHAQKEIREIAQAMLDQVKVIPGNPFEHSLKAFGL